MQFLKNISSYKANFQISLHFKDKLIKVSYNEKSKAFEDNLPC